MFSPKLSNLVKKFYLLGLSRKKIMQIDKGICILNGKLRAWVNGNGVWASEKATSQEEKVDTGDSSMKMVVTILAGSKI